MTSKTLKRWGLDAAIPALALGICAVAAQPAQAGLRAVLDSHVETDVFVNPDGDNNDRFEYRLFNDSQSFSDQSASSIAVNGPPGTNDGPFIVDWELPWFSDGGILESSIFQPTGWQRAIEQVGVPVPERGWGGIAAWQTPGDPFNDFLNDLDGLGNFQENGLTDAQQNAFLNATEVLHWYIAPDTSVSTGCTGPVSGNGVGDCSWSWIAADGLLPGLAHAILPGGNAGPFGFTAPGSTPLAAPYQASWYNEPVRTGDPPVPGQPTGVATPLSGLPNAVPAPGTLALLALGVAGLGAAARRKQARA